MTKPYRRFWSWRFAVSYRGRTMDIVSTGNFLDENECLTALQDYTDSQELENFVRDFLRVDINKCIISDMLVILA